jgi:hypothetical protein
MSDVWVVSIGKFASKKEMGDKLVLSPKEELGYEGIVIRLEEVQGGFIERGKQLLQKRRLYWFVGRE